MRFTRHAYFPQTNVPADKCKVESVSLHLKLHSGCILDRQAVTLAGDGYRGKMSPHTPNEKFEGATVLKTLQVHEHKHMPLDHQLWRSGCKAKTSKFISEVNKNVSPAQYLYSLFDCILQCLFLFFPPCSMAMRVECRWEALASSMTSASERDTLSSLTSCSTPLCISPTHTWCAGQPSQVTHRQKHSSLDTETQKLSFDNVLLLQGRTT